MENQSQPPSLQNQPNSPTVATPPTFPEATQADSGSYPPLNQPIKSNLPNLNTKNKKPLKYVLYILLLILIIGFAAVAYKASHPKAHKAQRAVVMPTYASHSVNLGGQKFALSFDKNATQRLLNANQTILSGSDLAGNNITVSLKAAPASSVSSNSCEGLKGTPSALLGDVTILNKSYPLCGIPSASASAQYFAYIGVRFQSNEQWYSAEFTLPQNVNYLIDKSTVKQIVESIAIQ